jgi:hypothetical protein
MLFILCNFNVCFFYVTQLPFHNSFTVSSPIYRFITHFPILINGRNEYIVVVLTTITTITLYVDWEYYMSVGWLSCYRVQSTEYRVQSTEYRVQSTEYRLRSSFLSNSMNKKRCIMIVSQYKR